MQPKQENIITFVESVNGMANPPQGSQILANIATRVIQRGKRLSSPNYNERYIDGGPAWGEHSDYNDGGQHGETHRPN